LQEYVDNTVFLESIIVIKGLFMDADVIAILAAIDAVSKKVDNAKDELKEDIKKVQETVDTHTTQLGGIVSVVAGQRSDVIKKTPDAINRIEERVGMEKTFFS